MPNLFLRFPTQALVCIFTLLNLVGCIMSGSGKKDNMPPWQKKKHRDDASDEPDEEPDESDEMQDRGKRAGPKVKSKAMPKKKG